MPIARHRIDRRVLHHFSWIRLAPMIPLEKNAMRHLLELKDIALLYELWTLFRLDDEITAAFESPPFRSKGLTSGPFGIDFAAGGTFEWASLFLRRDVRCGEVKKRRKFRGRLLHPRPTAVDDIACLTPSADSPIVRHVLRAFSVRCHQPT